MMNNLKQSTVTTTTGSGPTSKKRPCKIYQALCKACNLPTYSYKYTFSTTNLPFLNFGLFSRSEVLNSHNVTDNRLNPETLSGNFR